jgi:folate-binding protein YgfZ
MSYNFESQINSMCSSDSFVIERLNQLRILHLSGDQAEAFLQGQVTCDVTKLDENCWSWGAQCDPKGKMIGAFKLCRKANDFYLITPASLVEEQLMQFKKYAIFHQVNFAVLPLAPLGLTGKALADWQQENCTKAHAEATVMHHPNWIGVQYDADRMLMIQKDQTEWAHEAIEKPNSIWQAQDIMQALPFFEKQHLGQFVPQMLNLQALNAISLTKGCYIGQETIARMTYRGGNKRSLYILVGQSAQPHTMGDAIEVQLEKGWKKAGEVIQIAAENQFVMLTTVMQHHLDESSVFRFQSEEDSQLQIQSLPYLLT